MGKTDRDARGGHFSTGLEVSGTTLIYRTNDERKSFKRRSQKQKRQQHKRITAEALREWEADFDFFEQLDWEDDFQEMYESSYDLFEDLLAEDDYRYAFWDNDDSYSPYEYADDDFVRVDIVQQRFDEQQAFNHTIKPEDCGKSLGDLLEEALIRAENERAEKSRNKYYDSF